MTATPPTDSTGQASATGPAPDSAGPPDATRPGWLRDTSFFLAGQTISLLGSSLVQYAVLWHLTLTLKSGWVLALSAVFGFLPQGIVSIFGGVWADRFNRKYLIMAADGAIALVTAGLAIAFASGIQDLWLIFAVLAIRSLGAGIQIPAVSALLPQLVPVDKLMRVNGINGSIQSGITLLAPALAGWLYASVELQNIFLIDVTTAIIGIGILLAVRVAKAQAEPSEAGYLADLRAGLGYVWRSVVIRRVVLIYAIVMLLIVPPSYLTPLLTARTFGTEVWRLTALEIAFSVGMVLGGAIIAAWGGLSNRMAMIAGATIVFGVLAVGLGLSPWFWLFVALMGLTGLAVAGFSTPAMTLMQETADPAFQGRVFGVVGIVMAFAMPLGMVVFGPIADALSVEVILIVTGAAMAIIGVFAFSSSAAIGRIAEAQRTRFDQAELGSDDGADPS